MSLQAIVEVPCGYDRTNHPKMLRLVPLTVAEIKAWGEEYNAPRHQLYMIDRYGRGRHVRMNGKVQTWKRDTSRVSIPLKYGLYEAFRLDEHAINRGELLRNATAE